VSEVAALLSAIASLGTLIFAIVIWLQGRQIKQRGDTTHELVNSMSEDRLRLAGQQAYTAGRAARTEDRLDALENGKPPPTMPAA
jgi:hypothetical protein